jgi:predicted DNA-binding antitoxin AbrB/MazE fold protein
MRLSIQGKVFDLMAQMVRTQTLEAEYHDGQLTLLSPVDLEEGERVSVTITTQVGELSPEEIDARLRAAGLLVEIDVPEDAELLTEDELNRIWELPVGARPSEDIIREERDER